MTNYCMSYDPYGQDAEYSSPKVATMDKLRKEASEYHEFASNNTPNPKSSTVVRSFMSFFSKRLRVFYLLCLVVIGFGSRVLDGHIV